MKRREFLALVGGSTLAWPRAAGAQNPAQELRRIGAILALQSENDAKTTAAKPPDQAAAA
jgi:hypothetical protein